MLAAPTVEVMLRIPLRAETTRSGSSPAGVRTGVAVRREVGDDQRRVGRLGARQQRVVDAAAPGPGLRSSTSAWRASSSTSALPVASSAATTERLPAWSASRARLRSGCRTLRRHGPRRRSGSPAGPSISTTSAPRSPSSRPAYAPPTVPAHSTTRSPRNGSARPPRERPLGHGCPSAGRRCTPSAASSATPCGVEAEVLAEHRGVVLPEARARAAHHRRGATGGTARRGSRGDRRRAGRTTATNPRSTMCASSTRSWLVITGTAITRRDLAARRPPRSACAGGPLADRRVDLGGRAAADRRDPDVRRVGSAVATDHVDERVPGLVGVDRDRHPGVVAAARVDVLRRSTSRPGCRGARIGAGDATSAGACRRRSPAASRAGRRRRAPVRR